jgi:hypothetical protein
MPRSIVFLVAPRSLVFLDDVALVLVNRVARRNTELLVSARAKAIDVDARRVLHQHRRVALEARVVLDRACVHPIRMRIGVRRQIDLGA